jgi:hypothetical protein
MAGGTLPCIVIWRRIIAVARATIGLPGMIESDITPVARGMARRTLPGIKMMSPRDIIAVARATVGSPGVIEGDISPIKGVMTT